MNFQIEQFDPSPAVELWCERNPGSAQKRRHATYTRPSTAAAEEDLQPLEESDKKRRGRMKKRGRKNFHKLLFLQLNWTSCRGSSLAAWNHRALMTFFTC